MVITPAGNRIHQGFAASSPRDRQVGDDPFRRTHDEFRSRATNPKLQKTTRVLCGPVDAPTPECLTNTDASMPGLAGTSADAPKRAAHDVHVVG